MARQIGFHFYSFKVWQRYTREYETLSAVRGRQDILPLLHDGMQQIVNSQSNDAAAKRMACLKRVEVHDRDITGLVEAGGYGETANIVHSQNGKTTHRLQTDEAAMLPCFFRLVLPRNSERGIMVLQRDNRVPAKQSLTRMLQEIVGRFDKPLTCDLTPVANSATFDHMVRDGDVQELRFVRLSIPQDFADAYYKGRQETKGTVEVSYRANRGATLPLKQLLRGWLKDSASRDT